MEEPTNKPVDLSIPKQQPKKPTLLERLVATREFMHKWVSVILILLAVFLYIYASTAQGSVTNLCRTTCMDVLEAKNWNTGSFGLECYCVGAKNLTEIKQSCNAFKPFYNDTAAKSTG